MKIRDKIKALYKGELKERLKRLLGKKLGFIKKRFEIADGLNFEFNCSFIDSKRTIFLEEFENNKNIEQVILMNKLINIYNFENYYEKKFFNIPWYKIKISEYKKDVRLFWEINRLQFLPLFTLNLIINNKDEKLIEFLKNWEKYNPYNYGLNWVSNLEIAIRSISILLAYIIYLLKNNRNAYIEELLFKHAFHIYKDIKYTEKCIPNNHLIGEAVALYIFGNIFSSKYSKKWVSKSKNILKKYIEHIKTDGTYEEASLSYHRFVIQMFLLYYYFSKIFKDDFLWNKIEDRLEKSYIFFKKIEKPNGTYPQFGDWDDGVYFKLNNERIENFGYFVNTLGYICSYNNRKNLEIMILEMLFENIKIKNNEKTKLNLEKAFDIFDQGKYGVCKDKNKYVFINNQNQVFHSHSDGLSIELSLNSKDLLVDSGTYSYNLDRNLREYFRSTRAHNTVYLGFDQSTQVGSFRWIDQPKTILRKTDKGFSGEILYRNGSRHFREVVIEDEKIVIKDVVSNKKRKFIEINYHFHPDRNIKIVDDSTIIVDDQFVLKIKSNKKYHLKITESLYSKSYLKLTKRQNLKIIFNENKIKCETVFQYT